MKTKHIVLIAYALIGLGYAIYSHFFGELSYKGFGYQLGQGLVWPLVMFPGLGKIVGALLVTAMVAFILAT